MWIRFILTFLLFFFVFSEGNFMAARPQSDHKEPAFLEYLNDFWVDQQMERLSLDEKIAQLMMVAVYPRQEESVKTGMLASFRRWKPGGIIVMQGAPVKSVRWINEFQTTVPVPLLVAIDGEWGASMRIDSTIRYPYAQALGAIQDSAAIYNMGRDMARQLKQLGIQVNFAPVADVNTNPRNPVINFRSFGEEKVQVAQRAGWIAAGMQDAGVMAVAKHFPGHGDSETDSHLELPLINHSKARIDEVESFPFRYLTNHGIAGMMSAHLNVPALDDSGTPSSLSKKIIDGYLREEIGYQGLVITDAINMKGVQTKSGNTEVEALKAGNDIVLFVPDVGRAVASVKQALAAGEISLKTVEEKCRRVLAAKRWTGLDQYRQPSLKELTKRLNDPAYEVTNRQLIRNALTVLVNQHVLPVQQFDTLKIASVMIGRNSPAPFQQMMNRYATVDHFYLPKEGTQQSIAELRRVLGNYNRVIIGVEGINLYPAGNYGTTDIQRQGVADLIRELDAVVVFFGNAYALKHFENIHHAKGLILAYQNNTLTQELAAQLVFGAFNASGKLPVTVDHRFKTGDGIIIENNRSFSYTIPEEVGIDSNRLTRKVDSLAILGIKERAYPGCQVLIAVKGKVIFHKCYGYHTYEQEQEVTTDNLYDFASLTKVLAPLPAIMKLVEEKKISLDAPFATYWPDFKNIDKGRFPLRDYLTHQAHLPSWIPFWKMGLDNEGALSREVFASQPSDDFTTRVSSELYVNNRFKQAIYDTIKNIKILPVKRYVYSDLSFHLYPEMITQLTGMPYEAYLKTNFYKPMGATSLTYNPYLWYPLEMIIPTETDDFFRNEKLRGFVHDEGAAALGGISGNAGLFGTANDLAKLFQMYLQKGYYAGKRYFSEDIVNEFTRVQFPKSRNRRGLGFDKPLIDNHLKKSEDAYPALSAGKNSFGHTGYTGTMAWADPDPEVLFVFLSNRVHPTRENSMLFQLNIRSGIYQSIYDCLNY